MGIAGRLAAELAPVWRAVHARLSTGRPVRRVRVGPLDQAQQSALADLLGLAEFPGEFAVVPVDKLDEDLRASLGIGVREVVTELVGPIGDRAAAQLKASADRERLWSWLAGHPVVTAQPALGTWVDQVRRAGLIEGSVPETRRVLDAVLRVVGALPAAGEPLPVFAERVLGDTHALDEDSRIAGGVSRALAALYDVEVPGSAGTRRALWERAGVSGDELSPVVLCAGLRGAGDGVALEIAAACATAGEAAALTLRQVRSCRMRVAPRRVWVVENPSVLALAVARFGASCPPLVVTSGWPNSAVMALLRKLGSAGAELSYHGDFDGEGLRIAAHVVARASALPWRMGTEDYLGAVGESGPQVGRVSEVPWDAELAGHLARVGVAVSEERVAELLLRDLAEAVGDN